MVGSHRGKDETHVVLSDAISTSTVGWLHKANFCKEERPVHEDCSRHLARIMMKHESTIYAQHQTGKNNTIADILSRWHFLNDDELLTFIRCSLLTQIPPNLHISEVPNEIHCWVTSSLRKLKETTQSRNKHIKTRRERGNDGSPGCERWAATQTPSSLGLKELKKPEWSALLQSLLGEENTVINDTRDH